MKNSSITALIIVNTIPIFGLIFFGWSLFALMFFYWLENIVIGFYNILKINKAEGTVPLEKGIRIGGFGKASYSNNKSTFISFFLFHYGLFMTVHGFFVFGLFGPPDIPVFSLLIGVISLFISHGFSYFKNFIGKEEYKRVSPANLFGQPYNRLIVMHITIIFGGAVFQIFGLPFLSILVLVMVKTIIDAYSHKLEHKKFELVTILRQM